MKILLQVTKNTVWVIGRSSATSQFIDQLSSGSQVLSLRTADNVTSMVTAFHIEPAERRQVIFVLTAGLTYADLLTLGAFKSANPTIPIAICFSSAQLDLVSYAWALNFTAYLTTTDSSSYAQELLGHILTKPQSPVSYSAVFREWLRQYGILFENDQLPFSQTNEFGI